MKISVPDDRVKNCSLYLKDAQLGTVIGALNNNYLVLCDKDEERKLINNSGMFGFREDFQEYAKANNYEYIGTRGLSSYFIKKEKSN